MRIIDAMVRGLASAGIPPNVLTATGVTINVGCALLFGFGEFFWAGIVLIIANLFDMLDGNVARLTGNVTKIRHISRFIARPPFGHDRLSRHNDVLRS